MSEFSETVTKGYAPPPPKKLSCNKKGSPPKKTTGTKGSTEVPSENERVESFFFPGILFTSGITR